MIRRRRPRHPKHVLLAAAGLAGVAAFALACGAGRHPFIDGDQDEIPLPEGRPTPGGFGFDGSAGVGAHPNFGPTVSLTDAPPPLGGASLILARDGITAIATDPDRDRIVVANLSTKTSQSIALSPGDEPSRLVEDANRQVHVVLRRAGVVATFSLDSVASSSPQPITRRAICAAPQGVALSKDGATIVVACAGGELAALPSLIAIESSPATILSQLDRDLRDIVVLSDGGFMISRLRRAEILRVRADGSLAERISPAVRPNSAFEGGSERLPFVSWRMVAAPGNVFAGPGSPTTGNVIVVHQLARKEEVAVNVPNSYGSVGDPCGGIVTTTTTSIAVDSTATGALAKSRVLSGATIGNAAVPIDIAVAPDKTRYAIIAAGNAHTSISQQVNVVDATSANAIGACAAGGVFGITDPPGEAVAVAFTLQSALVVFTREPAAIHLHDKATNMWSTILAGGVSREDTGQAIFHANAGSGMACVSCHPEAGDDGRVWSLSTGARRTQSLKGTVFGTAPYHWGGDAPTMGTFAQVVFKGRMGGQELKSDQVTALRNWLEHVPTAPLSPPADTLAVARGKTLFEGKATCSQCHEGPRFTNNETLDVGTGGDFQVPSLLGVSTRAPYLHNGCVTSLATRFTNSCAGGDLHGKTSTLTADEVKDIVAYLETL